LSYIVHSMDQSVYGINFRLSRIQNIICSIVTFERLFKQFILLLI